MKIGIIRLYTGDSGKLGYYNMQELGLAKGLIENENFQVDIFILRNKNIFPEIEEIEINENIKIIYMPAISIGVHGIINPNFIDKYNIDIVHLSSDNQVNAARVIKWCTKKCIPIYTFIGTVQSDSNSKVKRFISKIIFNVNKIYENKIINVAKTQDVYNYLTKNGVKNVRLIPVGLDLEKLHQFEDIKKENLRKKYKLPLNGKIMLFIGRLEEYKNPIKAVEIFKYISEKNIDFKLLIVGTGELKEKLFQMISQYNLEDRFYYIDMMSNETIWELYSLSDVFINMNDKEIFGMSILEAMYYKCPVVAVKAPGPNYIIDNEKNGFLVEDFDLDNWYFSVEKAIKNSDQIAKESNELISKKLNWDQIAKQYYKLYKEITI